MPNGSGPTGAPIPLIAETGGQNALIVDSSALAEQVVADVLVSAFDSAGQRCSALRVLCLQDDIAERFLTMLKGALAELGVGNPDRLATDIGPVITPEARDTIAAHIDAMRAAGHRVHAAALPGSCRNGSFVAPTIIEIDRIGALSREVFGPVLHVLRYRRSALDQLIADVNATGYGLTFGVHTRIDETVSRAIGQANAGNIYVNRNLIGAVVGVQPFGGHGLSGTGPKAGGPLYLRRLLARCPQLAEGSAEIELPGPVGERNVYVTEPRGTVLCIAEDEAGRQRQGDAARAAANRVLAGEDHRAAAFDVVLYEGDDDNLRQLLRDLAARDGPIVTVHRGRPGEPYQRDGLLRERSISINTAAAGGNASLMTIG